MGCNLRLMPLAVALFLGACATHTASDRVSGEASPPPAPKKLSAADKEALAHLTDLSGWKQGPGILMKDCEEIDPTGVSLRKTAYDQWMLEHQQDWESLDRLEKEIIPKILTINGSPYPVKGVHAMVLVNVSRLIYFMDPQAKAKACTDLTASSGLFRDPTWKKEAYAYLEKWVSARQSKK